ncbi:MAG: hypothetical protein KBF78_07730 [Fuscovulum sp.]|nr:hypothetical protein [Fuscovulum sp.]
MAFPLPLVALLAGWVLLPLALRPLAALTGLPASGLALTATAGAACLLALLNGIEPVLVRSSQPEGMAAAYHDTYYIVVLHEWLKAVAFMLLGLGGLALIAQGTAAGGWLGRVPVAGHWSAHLGSALVALPSLPLVPMPRRYVDYPDAFFWKTVMTNAGLALWFTGAGLVLAALLLSLLRKLLGR